MLFLLQISLEIKVSIRFWNKKQIVFDTTTGEEVAGEMIQFRELLAMGKQVAFVVRKGALEFDEKIKYENSNTMIS